MAIVSTSTVEANGLPIHHIGLPGTRALTVLVAFDAGARNERPQENGMAHFLEHLVFKGGESYPTYKDVNETAERLGGVLNAYTSHDLVAFHITVRAESAPQAIDLLSDFVGRPRLDAEELDRERGVVIQEINRAYDQPSTVAEYLIDRAAFGDHPLGRTVLGPEENLRSFTREGIVAFRERRWAGARGGAFLVGNLEHVPAEAELQQRFARFPSLAEPEPYVPAPEFAPQKLADERDTNQSHLRMIYRPQIAVSNVRERAALSIYSTLLGGSMGSRLFEEIREKRGLCYSVYALNHTFADVPILQLGSGLESAKAVEAYTRMREIVDELRSDGPTEEEVARARAYAAGRLVLAFENTNAVARYSANQQIVFGEDIDPDAAIAALDAVTYDEVREVAAGVADNLAVAVVGPHSADEF
ncbi:MAG TPA: pitrilysin family protein [Solirubrobacteraceae bacterium]|jgi:predicted Zn-dependent peptidase|nr:pitrilysin family protein [Solirubrobacteraceae bacterium]